MENIELAESGKAPDFSLIGSDNLMHNLSDYKGKNVILYFYPKDNTGGWINEASSFRDNMKEIEFKNAVVIGISRDSIKSHQNFIQKYNLPFLLLSDNDSEVCNLYGVIKEKTMYGKKSFGIERSTFIIDEDGHIKKIYRKVKIEGHVEDVLKQI